MRNRLALACPLLALALLAPAPAQGVKPAVLGNGSFPGGTWVNFESPHCKPITVAKVLNAQLVPRYYLLVCNTADCSLEIYSLNVAALPILLTRIKVGQDPVSVLWRPPLVDEDITGYIYTANMVGDSISMIEFGFTSSQTVPTARLLRTVNVGDEPMHMALNPATGSLYVSLNSRHAMAIVNGMTLAPVIPDPHFWMTTPITFRPSQTGQPMTEDVALAQPRTIFTRDFGFTVLVYALGGRGSHTNPTHNQFEAGFDLWVKDIMLSGASVGRKGLGTKNFNMVLDATSNGAWVVSGDAANLDQKGKANVAGVAGGFVKTLLHLVTDVTNPASTLHTLDLNAGATAATSLSHCTDVAVLEKANPTTYDVYVTAFNKDAIARISNVKAGGTWNAPGLWTKTRLSLSRGANTFAGPTSLAVKLADPAAPNDPGERIYVLSRFANAIDVVDPANFTTFASVPMTPNPEPAYIQVGRRFLHSADVGNGFNSCASCHFDGRLDSQAWDLSGNLGDTGNPFNLNMVSSFQPPSYTNYSHFGFTQPKGEFITQSLQGLVNFEVDSNTTNGTNVPDLAQQSWFSNAPYHWDGDEPQFRNFNTGGVQNLLGGMLLSTNDMRLFTNFINSIHYPPNYEQPKERKHSGTLGTLHGVNAGDGSGGMRGLKLYHIRNINDGVADAGRSCAQCHQLPEGSDNLGTEFLPSTRAPGLTLPFDVLPIETSALRGLDQKQALYFPMAVNDPNRFLAIPPFGPPYNTTTPPLFASQFLLFSAGTGSRSNAINHLGTSVSINEFIGGIFVPTITLEQAGAITNFVREMDHGVAPMIGEVISVEVPGATETTTFGSPIPGRTITIKGMKEQVRVVNCGLAVTGTLAGVQRGFWYDPQPTGGLFFDVTNNAISFTANALLAQMATGDLLVFEVTPLGMDRRRAHPTGVPPALGGPAPSNVALSAMVPNTAYERVPELKSNWDPNYLGTDGALPFVWAPAIPGTPEPWQLKAIRLMQAGNGLTATLTLRHEAPRRFRVSGHDIRHGAILELWIPKVVPGTGNPPPDAAAWHLVELPLFPTSETLDEGSRIWETAAELDPFWANAFALGGPFAPGIDNVAPNVTDMQTRSEVAAVNELNPGALFNKAAWNRYRIRVVNEDGQASPFAIDQPISLQPPPWAH